MFRLQYSLFFLCLTWSVGHAIYPIVLAYPRECTSKLYHIWMTVTDWGFESMYIDPDNPQPMVRGFDICRVPSQGRVTIPTCDMLGLATKETAQNVDEDTKVLVQVQMSRTDCEKLTGQTVVSTDETVTCDFYLEYQSQEDGRDVRFTEVMPLAGVGECPEETAPVVLPLKNFAQEKCETLGGVLQGSDCQLDLCYTDSEAASRCVPSDAWSQVQTCTNDGANEDRCTVTVDVGIEDSSEPRETVPVLQRLFSELESTAASEEFNWANTVDDDATWSRTGRRTLQVLVPSQKTVQVEQLVGTCGDTSVRMASLRAVEQPGGRITRLLATSPAPAARALLARWKKYWKY